MKTADTVAQIEGVLSTFDFELVHAYMRINNWKWMFLNEEPRVPTILELQASAYVLLLQALRSELQHSRVSSGGLQALKWTWPHQKEGEYELSLQFVLAR